MIKTCDLYDLTHTQAAPLLEKTEYPWEALADIGDFILALGPTLSPEEYDQPRENVWVAKDAEIYPSAYIKGPCIIGPGTEVRPGAFIRGNALVGSGCVVGNSTELKNVILFDGVLLGDRVEIGCNSVLNPGTVVGRDSMVYPVSSVRGVIPANSIYKAKDNIVTKE